MFKNMKLGTKISVGFGLLILIACLLGSLAVYNMKNVEGQSTVLAHEYVPEVALANEVERSSLETMYAVRGYNFTGEDEYLKTAREHFSHLIEKLEECKELSRNSTQLVKLEGYAEDCLKNSREYERLTNEVEKKNKGIEECRHELDTSAASYMQNCNDFLAGQNIKMENDIKAGLDEAKLDERLEKITIVNDIIDVGNATRIAAFKSQALRSPKIIQDAQKNFSVMAEKFAALSKICRSADDIKRIEDTKKAADEYKIAMNTLLEDWIAVQELAQKQDVAGEAVLTGARDTAKAGIEGTTKIADAAVAALGTSSTIMITGLIAALTIGVLLAFFITRSIVGPITRIILGLTEGSEQVSSAAGQVSSASQSLAEGATEQAAGLEETSSSLEEMASMTKQNADNAQQANALASDASKAANTGNESMGRMNTAIQDIQESSDKTAKIIKVIDEIAFQTNLLALNAAVEAARAGEAGKGFAVVAEEVRNLAMRSAEAAKDTSAMIEESVKNANNGVEIATEVSKVLEDIVEGITKTTDLVGEIAAASQEQSQGIDQVNTAVSQMDKVTQANAANAEESASASEELSAQAEQMNGIVEELSAMVGGSSQSNTSRPAKALKKSDHTFHQIANGKSNVKTAQNEAEKSIPLGNAGDFDSFNS